MPLSKRSVALNFIATGDQSQSQAISTLPLKTENVVVNKVGQFEKRHGYSVVGKRILGQSADVTNIRYIAEREGELIAMADSGCFKYSGSSDKMIQITTSILTEVDKTSIIRNNFNQSYAQGYKFSGRFVTIYQDSRGGYRYSVLDEESNTLIVNDVSLGTVNKGSIFEHDGELYLFYVRVSDSKLCFRQFDISTFYLSSEKVVQNVVVTGDYRVKYFTSSTMVIGYVGAASKLSIGCYKIDDGTQSGPRDAVPDKFEINDTFSATFDFDVLKTAGSSHVNYRIAYVSTGYLKYANFDELGVAVVSPTNIVAYTDIHSATFEFSSAGVFIAWDKTAVKTQEYLTYCLKIDYTGSVTMSTVLLGAGLSLVSEAFQILGVNYVACCYSSLLQPNIFIISESGSVISKFNKDSALTHRTNAELVIPIMDGNRIRIPLETRTAFSNPAQTGGEFFTVNYGISIFNINYGYGTATHAVLNRTLYVSGAILRHYDGATFTEAGFLLRPDENIISATSTAVKASGFITSTGKLTFTARALGTGGNAISVAFTTGATAGSEVVSVVGNAISVQIQSGVSTAAQIHTKLQASAPAMALIDDVVTTAGAMVAPASVTLTGGAGGDLSAGQYQYMACYAWTDNLGDLHRSGLSVPITYVALANDKLAIQVPNLFMTEKQNVWIEIYRTTANSTISHLIGFVPNDRTAIYSTYVDSASDASIAGRETAYTTGGVLNNTSYQTCKIVTVSDNRIILGGTEDRDSIYYTKPYQNGVAPSPVADFRVDIGAKGGNIVAVKSFGSVVLVLKETLVGVISGLFALNTGLDVSLRYEISSEEFGCISKRGLVEIDKGLLFQSQRGICLYTKSMVPSFIGGPVLDLAKSPVTSMALLADKQTVMITFENSYAICMNYWANAWTTFDNHRGYASVAIGNDYYYLSTSGQIFKKDETSVTDAGNPVLVKIRSPWYQLGSLGGFERLYKAFVQGVIQGEHGFIVNIYYDFELTPRETLKYVTGKLTVFGNTGTFGDVIPLGEVGMTQQIRIQPRFQKCSAVSIEIEEILPHGYTPSAGCTWHGIRLELGIKTNAWKFNELAAATTLLSGS